jgi:hypothetical protein
MGYCLRCFTYVISFHSPNILMCQIFNHDYPKKKEMGDWGRSSVIECLHWVQFPALKKKKKQRKKETELALWLRNWLKFTEIINGGIKAKTQTTESQSPVLPCACFTVVLTPGSRHFSCLCVFTTELLRNNVLRPKLSWWINLRVFHCPSDVSSLGTCQGHKGLQLNLCFCKQFITWALPGPQQ